MIQQPQNHFLQNNNNAKNKSLNSFQRMNLIQIRTKQEFQSIKQELESAKQQYSPIGQQQSNLSVNSKKPVDNNLLPSTNLKKQEQVGFSSSCNLIAVPRCGKISSVRQKPQLKIRQSFQNNKCYNQSLTRGFTIQYSGYIRYCDLGIIFNTNNKVSHDNTNNRLSPSMYNPSQPDLQFLSTLRQHYQPKLNNSYTLSTKTFIDIIMSCQDNYHKKKTINLQQSTSDDILLMLEFKLPSKLTILTNQQKLILSQMFKQVVQYWRKVKVQQYKLFPMIRSLWPKTDLQQQKYQYFVPYKSRTLQKDHKQPILSSSFKNIKHQEYQQTMNKYQQTISKYKKNNVISYNNKFMISSSFSIKNKLGRTQRQTKINRQCKQLSTFYTQINQFAQQNLNCRQFLQDKQLRKLHKIASIYNLNQPSWFKYLTRGNITQDKIVNNLSNNNKTQDKDKKNNKTQDKKNNKTQDLSIKKEIKLSQINNKMVLIKSKLKEFRQQPYFNRPLVRLLSNRSTNNYQRRVQNQYNISYDSHRNQLLLSNGHTNKTQIKRHKKVKKSN